MHTALSPTQTLGRWLLLALALLLSSTAWAQRDSGQYQIQHATYGTDQYSIDVTERLRQLASRDDRFKLTNELFGADPAPGQRKTLRIHARGPDGQTRVFDYRESSWVEGEQFTGWRGGRWGRGYDNRNDRPGAGQGQTEILQATYGADGYRVDVTQRVRQLMQRNQRYQVSNELFQSDPAPGRRKTLQIHTRDARDARGGYGGQPHVLEFAEGSWIDSTRITGASAGAYDPRNPGARPGDVGYGRINIQRASYGDGYRRVDVTARLRSLVRDGRLELPVDNQLSDIDPAYGVTKTLQVEFSVGNGPLQQTTVREGDWLRLP